MLIPSFKCSGPRQELLPNLLLKRGSALRSDQAEFHSKKCWNQGQIKIEQETPVAA